jgi:hypothetical protein
VCPWQPCSLFGFYLSYHGKALTCITKVVILTATSLEKVYVRLFDWVKKWKRREITLQAED